MYQASGDERVVELQDVPQSSVGAPCPLILSDEHSLVLAYYVQDTPDGWDGTTVRVVGYDKSSEPAALIHFSSCYARLFGPPNDEAFSGHPLAARGLRPYSANLVENSPWIRALERMNAVHPYHNPQVFARWKHFILAFHDTTFECVADGYSVHLRRGALADLTKDMKALLWPEKA